VKIDAGAPTTSVSGADDLWHDSDVDLSFSGSDAGSGVATTEYRIDGGAWITGASMTVPAPADGSNDGVHAVEYRSTDAFGHVEAARSLSVRIGHLDTRARYVRHKLSLVRVTWPATAGAVSYDVVVEGAVVATTVGLDYLYAVPGWLQGVDLTIEVVSRDGGGLQLRIDGREQEWRKQ
jgi:hypothetical protein